MSSELPHLPKYKLNKRNTEAESEEAPASQQTQSAAPREEPKRPLQLSQAPAQTPPKDSMLSTAEMLEDAYGAETRKRRRNNLISKIKHICTTLFIMLLFCAGTLAYAHAYKAWPRLEPTNWYLPFLLSAILSAWLCLKSIHFWQNREGWLALSGLLFASSVIYWNTYVLEYATLGEQTKPSNALWVPKDVIDLEIITELNALRGVSKNMTAYTELQAQAYYQAFNAMGRENWRPYFERFLSPAEIRQTNSLNINASMHLAVERMRAQRANIWTSLQEQLEQPSTGFRLRQALLKPYTWLLSYL